MIAASGRPASSDFLRLFGRSSSASKPSGEPQTKTWEANPLRFSPPLPIWVLF
jgi:hypothetical protein